MASPTTKDASRNFKSTQKEAICARITSPKQQTKSSTSTSTGDRNAAPRSFRNASAQGDLSTRHLQHLSWQRSDRPLLLVSTVFRGPLKISPWSHRSPPEQRTPSKQEPTDTTSIRLLTPPISNAITEPSSVTQEYPKKLTHSTADILTKDAVGVQEPMRALRSNPAQDTYADATWNKNQHPIVATSSMDGQREVGRTAENLSAAGHATGLRKLTEYIPPPLPSLLGARPIPASCPSLPPQFCSNQAVYSADASTQNTATKSRGHMRGSSVPNEVQERKTQLKLSVDRIRPYASNTSGQAPAIETISVRKHSLDSSMDRLSEALSTEQGPRREGTDSGRMDQDSSNSNVTSMKRSTLSNMNNATTVSCSIPIPNEPPNQKISRKQSSILEAAIGTFPEFQVHLEEPRHSNEKANKNKVSTNNMKLDYSNQCRGESRETPARRKPSGSAVDNVDPELHVLKRRLRVQPSQMENVEKISETSTNSPLISSVTAVSGKTTAPTVATSRTPKRKKSTELENASRPTLISKDRSPSSSLTLTGPKMDSSKRRKPKRSSSEITTTESALPSQDITSSAAFEANMFDIEQYVEQDLQGYNQLSY